MRSQEGPIGTLILPTLHGLSQLPARDARVREYVVYVGLRLMKLIDFGRWAFRNGEQQELDHVMWWYAEIRGEGGRPDCIDSHFQEGKTFAGNMRVRAAAAKIIAVSTPLNEETILRYLRTSRSLVWRYQYLEPRAVQTISEPIIPGGGKTKMPRSVMVRAELDWLTKARGTAT